jgi:hypothetical protein
VGCVAGVGDAGVDVVQCAVLVTDYTEAARRLASNTDEDLARQDRAAEWRGVLRAAQCFDGSRALVEVAKALLDELGDQDDRDAVYRYEGRPPTRR